MTVGRPLRDHLDRCADAAAQRAGAAEVIGRLAAFAADLSDMLAIGDLARHAGIAGEADGGGHTPEALDARANAMVRAALDGSPVAVFASEQQDGLEIVDRDGSACLAVDPIDGYGNIALNMPVGTIFSLSPVPAGERFARGPDHEAFTWPAGARQCAAGFMLYGPQTTLVVTVGPTVDMFTLDRQTRTFRLTRENLRIAAAPADEFAINVANYRHWEEPVRTYIDECIAGASGPFGRDLNMRWHGALVADAHRILARGGLYLYPADARPGYRSGRLRLIYEACPIALLMERAGGAASDGRRRILDVVPQSLHQRVPLILGSKTAVDAIRDLHHRPGLWPETAAPLFTNRGLFRS